MRPHGNLPVMELCSVFHSVFQLVIVMRIHGFSVNAMSEDYQLIIRCANSAFEQLLNVVSTASNNISGKLQFCSRSWQEVHTDLSPPKLSQGALTDTRSVSGEVCDDGVDQPIFTSSYSE